MESLVKPSNSVIDSVFVPVADDVTIDESVLKSCRCCLRRPPSDLYLGDMGIYLDILKECFNILLTEAGNSPGICEVCVGRVQDASDFKLEVVRCQEELRVWLEDNQADEEPVVKAETDEKKEDGMNDRLCLDSPRANKEFTVKLEVEDDENENIICEEGPVKSEALVDAASDDEMSYPLTDAEQETCARVTDHVTKACSVRLERLRGGDHQDSRKRKLTSNAEQDDAVGVHATEECENSEMSATSKKRKRGQSWTEEGLRAAIDAVQSGRLNQRAACRKFNIPRRTLRGHLERGSITKRMGRKPIFTESQESDLAAIIKRFAEAGVYLTKQFIKKQAYLFCETHNIHNSFNDLKQTAGAHWLNTFLNRNPSISVRKPQINLSSAQIQILNKSIVEEHFQSVKKLHDELNIPKHPERLYAIGDKGSCVTVQTEQALDEKRGHIITLEHAEKVTICMCINAIGTAIPPMILFEGQTPDLENNLPVGTLVRMTPKGNESDLLVEFIHHFAKHKVAGKCLLVADGSKYPLSCEALDEAEKNEIVLYILPSNMAHVLQPLDRVNKSFKHHWNAVMKLNADVDKKITKTTFNEIFSNVWPKCMTHSNIVNSFKATGLFPFNPEAIPEEAFAQLTRNQCNTRNTSILSEDLCTSNAESMQDLESGEEIGDLDFSVKSRDSKMSTNTKRRKRGESWTEEGLRAAIDAVQSGRLNQRAACRKFNIPRRTLRGHLERGSITKRLGRKPIFTESQESDLAAIIKRFAEVGVTVTAGLVKKQANLFCEKYNIKNKFNNANQRIGSDWLKQFLKRHPTISIMKQHSMSRAQVEKLNKTIAEQHFRAVKKLYDELSITQHPERLYNMDEKGSSITVDKQQALDEKRGHLIALKHADNVTICMCINAIGTTIPPMILFEGRTPDGEENLPAGTLVRLAPKGMTSNLFVEFIKHLGKYKVAGKCLLVLDGTKSHLSCDALEEADKNDIILYCLPSNTMREQPLNKSANKSYDLWDAATTNATFNEVFSNVWHRCMTHSNIVNSFKETGLFPFNLAVA